MSDAIPQLILIGALVILNAALSGAEMALVSLRQPQLQRLEQASNAGRSLAKLARDPNRFLATVQIGITLAGFLASAAAAVSLSEPVETRLDFLGGAAAPVALISVTLALSYLTLVFGELAPKRIAMQRAERWGLVMAKPLTFLSTATRPFVWLLSRSTDAVVRLAGGDPEQHGTEVTDEEIRDLVAMRPSFTPAQRQIVDGAFEIAERSLAEVLVPRGDVVVLDAELSCDAAVEALRDAGHSRAPVASDANLDDATGFVHLRDLVGGAHKPVEEMTSELLVFPEQAKVLKVLREMQDTRQQIALVVNEHGAADGIVTIEDLVEELVGEIYDESDRDRTAVRSDEDGTVVLPGRFAMHEVPETGIDLPSGDYTTVAGLVLDHLGRIPDVGDKVEIGNYEIVVRAMKGRAIAQVAVSPIPDVV